MTDKKPTPPISPSDRADLDRLFPDGWNIVRRHPSGVGYYDVYTALGVFEVVFDSKGRLIIVPNIEEVAE